MLYLNVHRSTLQPAGGHVCMDGSGRGAHEVMEIAMKSRETEAGMLRMSYSELFHAALAANWMN